MLIVDKIFPNMYRVEDSDEITIPGLGKTRLIASSDHENLEGLVKDCRLKSLLAGPELLKADERDRRRARPLFDLVIEIKV